MPHKDDSDYCVFGASKNVSKWSTDNYCRGGPVLKEFIQTKEFKEAAQKWISIVASHKRKSDPFKVFKIKKKDNKLIILFI